MHLSYLREYVVLARYMNISKASRELNMTQSNLSKHVRQIELEVGADLVSHGNRLEFTPAGLFFLDQANKVVDLFDDRVPQMPGNRDCEHRSAGHTAADVQRCRHAAVLPHARQVPFPLCRRAGPLHVGALCLPISHDTGGFGGRARDLRVRRCRPYRAGLCRARFSGLSAVLGEVRRLASRRPCAGEEGRDSGGGPQGPAHPGIEPDLLHPWPPPSAACAKAGDFRPPSSSAPSIRSRK